MFFYHKQCWFFPISLKTYQKDYLTRKKLCESAIVKILLSTNANRLNNVRLPNYCFYLSILIRKFLFTFYDAAFAHAQEYKLYIVWFHILSTVITTLIVVFNGNFKCLSLFKSNLLCMESRLAWKVENS